MRLPFFLFLFLISTTEMFAQSKLANISHLSVTSFQNDENSMSVLPELIPYVIKMIQHKQIEIWQIQV